MAAGAHAAETIGNKYKIYKFKIKQKTSLKVCNKHKVVTVLLYVWGEIHISKAFLTDWAVEINICTDSLLWTCLQLQDNNLGIAGTAHYNIVT